MGRLQHLVALLHPPALKKRNKTEYLTQSEQSHKFSLNGYLHVSFKIQGSVYLPFS